MHDPEGKLVLFMTAMRFIVVLGLGILSSCAGLFDQGDLTPIADRMVKGANAWGPGDRLSGDLLEHRGPEYEGFCIGLITDTRPVFSRITNYELLIELVCRPGVHDRVYEYALERALLLRGPSRVFEDVERNLDDRPQLFRHARYQRLFRRADEPHAWIDGLYLLEDRKSTRLN